MDMLLNTAAVTKGRSERHSAGFMQLCMFWPRYCDATSGVKHFLKHETLGLSHSPASVLLTCKPQHWHSCDEGLGFKQESMVQSVVDNHL